MTNVNLKIYYLGKIDFAESNYWRMYPRLKGSG